MTPVDTSPIRISSRFQGPSGSGQGGWTSARFAERIGVPADEATDLIRSPEEIQALPPIERQAVIDSVALGVGRVYLVCAGVFAIGFVLALLLPERPLRLRAGLSDAMEQQSADA